MSDKVVTRRSGGFTQIDNEIVNNPKLTWKAKGIMLYFLSKPDNWKINVRGDVIKRGVEGRDSVYKGINELIDNGYISRVKDETGNVTYYLFENKNQNDKVDYLRGSKPNPENQEQQKKPDPENQEPENQEPENQEPENQDVLVRLDSNNTENSNTKNKHYGITDAETAQVVEIWNSILNVPNIRSLPKTSARYKALNARYKEHGFEVILEMLMLVRTSRFLQGDNKENWMPNFGWVLNPENFLKVLEGTYNKDKRVNHERSNSNNQTTPKLSTYQQRAIALSESVDQNRHILDEMSDDDRF